MFIRDFRLGEEAELRAVFFSSVHELTLQEYSLEQIEAWAPWTYNTNQWVEKIHAIQPFVAEINGRIAGYADLQPSGYIDHFYVAAPFAGRGVGSALMDHIHQIARKRQIAELWANVSLTAEPFFANHGFIAEARNSIVIRGVTLSNTRMRKRLQDTPTLHLLPTGNG